MDKRDIEIKLTDEERIALNDRYNRRLIKKRFYQWALDQATGKKINWPHVSDKLKQRVGIKIPHETLRQNIEPSNRSKGKPARNFRNFQRWMALYKFLIHDAIGYLSPQELMSEDLPLIVFSPLQEFLSPNSSEFPDSINGRYSTLWGSNNPNTPLVTLDIEHPSSLGMPRIVFHEEREKENAPDMTFHLKYDGAIVGNIDFAILIMRNRVTEDPKICLVGQTSPSLKKGEIIESMALWNYEGVSHHKLKTINTEYSVEENSKDHTLSHINYQFQGVMPTIFLTRC